MPPRQQDGGSLTPKGAGRLQGPCPRKPQLFVALNRNEVQEYIGGLQNQVDREKDVHDTVLALWQRETTESVLYYDGEYLMSARLAPKLFLQSDRSHIDRRTEACLTDVRYIDVGETGRAMHHKS